MVSVWLGRASGASLLQDSDTRGILAGIRARGNPWSWFAGDWPLENHFYRPIPTLFFELDNWLFGGSSAGYGATNALIVCPCVGLLFWVGSELFGSLRWGVLGALLFAYWLLPQRSFESFVVLAAGFAAALTGWEKIRERPRNAIWITCLFLLVWTELQPIQLLHFRTVGWLPGRTATVMTLFALASIGAFLTWQRRCGWGWLLACLLAVALAMASYEQAVMLPLVLCLMAFLRPQFPVRGAVPVLAACWGLLFAYLVVRSQLVPSEVSRYQDQQFRFGPGVWLSLTDYFAPPLGYLGEIKILAESYFLPLLMTATSWWSLLHFPAFFGGVWALVRAKAWRAPLILGLASAFSFAPMAFLKPFEHYHFWPMALRALFVVSLLAVLIPSQEEAEE